MLSHLMELLVDEDRQTKSSNCTCISTILMELFDAFCQLLNSIPQIYNKCESSDKINIFLANKLVKISEMSFD